MTFRIQRESNPIVQKLETWTAAIDETSCGNVYMYQQLNAE